MGLWGQFLLVMSRIQPFDGVHPSS